MDGLDEMQRYRSHKEVEAFKIRSIDRNPEGGAILWPSEPSVAPVLVDLDYIRRHNPQEGGYFVVYNGGEYCSFSPAKAFESGYTPVA